MRGSIVGGWGNYVVGLRVGGELDPYWVQPDKIDQNDGMGEILKRAITNMLQSFLNLTKSKSESMSNKKHNASGHFPDWKYRLKISIKNEKLGKNVLENFIMRFVYQDFENAKNIHLEGHDFFFTASDGTTKLSHEIRFWKRNTGELEAKIKIPRLDPTQENVFFMYYGNLISDDQQNPSDLWSEYPVHKYLDTDLQTMALLRFYIAVLELIFPSGWFEKNKASSHPAIERWNSCHYLLKNNGELSSAFDNSSTLMANFRAIGDASIISKAMNGDPQQYLIGNMKNYGAQNVMDRIRSEIVDPTKYLDILNELDFACWCRDRNYTITTYQETGADHRIEIPTWDKPVIADCKRLSKEAGVTRIGKMIAKANHQIKIMQEKGYGLVVINLTDKLSDIIDLRDKIPDQLEQYIVEANTNIGNKNSSVSAVILYWTETHIIGDVDRNRLLMLIARTRSKVLTHRNPINPITYNLEDLNIERQLEISVKKQ
jgi:hypothetical protein